MNIGLSVTRITQRAPHSLALFDGERTMDYATLDQRSNRLAHALRTGYAFNKGERVALLVHNCMEVVEVLVGVSKAAMVYVGLNFRMTEPELVSVLANAEPRMIITEPEFEAMAQRLAALRNIPVLVASDNVQDPFCPVGSFDPLEALATGVLAAQLESPFDRWSEALCRADWLRRSSAQLPLQAGSAANLVVFTQADVWGFPSRTQPRVVLRKGRVTRGLPPAEWQAGVTTHPRSVS